MHIVTNISLGVSLIIFVVFGLPYLYLSILRRKESDATLFFALLCISNALWGLCQALFYLLPSEPAALFFYQIRLVFIGYTALFTYLFALQSLQHHALSASGMISLLLVPAATGILVLLNPHLHLIYRSLSITQENGVRVPQAVPGLWFWVQVLVCYICVATALPLMLRHRRRLHQNFRAPLTIMIAVTCISLGLSFLNLSGVVPYGLNFTPYFVQIAHITFYYTLYNSHTMDVLFTSREVIFEDAANATFILDQDGRIMDLNKKAQAMGEALDFETLHEVPFTHFIDTWVRRSGGRRFEEDESIVTLVEGSAEVHYQLSQSGIHGQRQDGTLIGAYAEIKNVTPIMSTIHKLQDAAYFDQLTGLSNRRSFVQMLPQLDRPECWPLAVVVGDVNRLKAVNDTFGHAVGDLLLQQVTQVLLESSPKSAVWFRVGGDEFTALVPNCSAQALDDLVRRVNGGCGAFTDARLAGAGIAVAYRIKTGPAQDMAALMHEADAAMYAGKRNRRTT